MFMELPELGLLQVARDRPPHRSAHAPVRQALQCWLLVELGKFHTLDPGSRAGP